MLNVENGPKVEFQNSNNADKEIKHTLEGMKKQVIDLAEITKNTFSQVSDTLQLNWNERLKEVIEKINDGLTKANIPVKHKNLFFEDLEKVLTSCQENLKNLQQLDADKETGEKQKLKDLNSMRQFIDDPSVNKALFGQIICKLEWLKNKIESHNPTLNEGEEFQRRLLNNLLFRVRKVYPDYMILNPLKKSFSTDERRLDKYNKLKNIWLDSVVKFKTLEDGIEKSILSYEILPDKIDFSETFSIPATINTLCETLQNQKIYFETLTKHLESISTPQLALGYVKKYHKIYENEEIAYKRDLSDIFKKINAYKDCLSRFNEEYKIVIGLNDSLNKFFPLVKNVLDKIPIAIQSIFKRDYDKFVFVDKEMCEKLKLQKQESIKNLIQLQNDLEKKWNQFFMDLNELNHQINTFIAFKNITEKMSWCHLLAENIQGDLRHLRKTENDRSKHYMPFYSKLNEYNTLCKVISQTNKTNDIEKIKILDVKRNFIDQTLNKSSNDFLIIDSCDILSKIKNSAKNFNLLAEYKQVLQLQESISLSNLMTNDLDNDTLSSPMKIEHDNDQYTKSIGLVWTTEDKKIKAINEFYEQKVAFANELRNYKKIICDAFTKTLPQVCMDAVNEINVEGKTLSTPSTDYDSQFTLAYYPENRVGKFVQVKGVAVKNKFNEWMGYTQAEEKPRGPFVEVKSPFDLIKF